MQRPICSPETKDLVAAGFQKYLYPLWESAQEYLQCENAARKNIQVGFYIKIGGKKKITSVTSVPEAYLLMKWKIKSY